MAVECRVERLGVLADEQRAQLRALRWDAVALREEVATIRKRLAEHGLMSEAQFLVQLHKHRFAAACLAHPRWSSGARFSEVVGTNELASALALWAGPAGTSAAAAASLQVKEAFERMWPGSVCVIGGFDGERELHTAERFSPVTGVWVPMPPMHQARAGAVAAVAAGKLHVCGGSDGLAHTTSVERFDPLGGSWQEMPPMFAGRSHAAAAGVDGALYVCGGSNDTDAALATVERLVVSMDSAIGEVAVFGRSACAGPEGWSWERMRPMSCRRWGAVATTAGGGHLLCCYGGFGDDAQGVEVVELLDPRGGPWRLQPPTGKRSLRAGAVVIDGLVYAFGGRQNPTSSAWFEPLLENMKIKGARSHALPPMTEGRWDLAAVFTGRVYVCGGSNKDGCLHSAERFNLRTGSWEVLPPMQERRSRPAAAVLGWT